MAVTNNKLLTIFAAILSATLLFAISASASYPLEITHSEINGITVQPNTADNLLLVQRDSTLTLNVQLKATEQITKLLELRATISGLDQNAYSKDKVEDSKLLDNFDKNTIYPLTFTLKLPSDLEQDTYTISLTAEDKNSNELSKWTYTFKLGTQRHNIQLKEAFTIPTNTVRAGESVIVKTRVKNVGEKEERIRIEAKLENANAPITATATVTATATNQASDVTYIEALKPQTEKDAGDLYLLIPECTPAGKYNIIVNAEYNENRETTSKILAIKIVEGTQCISNSQTGNTITGPETINAVQKTTTIIPLTITNPSNERRALKITLQGIDDWATSNIQPSNIVMINAGESATVNAELHVNKDATKGTKIFTATASEATSGETVSKQTITLNIQEQETQNNTNTEDTITNIIYGILIVLVIIFAIAVLVLAFKKEEQPIIKQY